MFLRHNLVIIILALCLAAALAAAGYLGWMYYSLRDVPESISSGDSAAETIAKVSRLIVLPEGETPTIATVTDPEQLKNQPFFERAKAGDQLLIYPNAKKAILYDPAADRIVEVAPLNLGNSATSSAQ